MVGPCQYVVRLSQPDVGRGQPRSLSQGIDCQPHAVLLGRQAVRSTRADRRLEGVHRISTAGGDPQYPVRAVGRRLAELDSLRRRSRDAMRDCATFARGSCGIPTTSLSCTEPTIRAATRRRQFDREEKLAAPSCCVTEDEIHVYRFVERERLERVEQRCGRILSMVAETDDGSRYERRSSPTTRPRVVTRSLPLRISRRPVAPAGFRRKLVVRRTRTYPKYEEAPSRVAVAATRWRVCTRRGAGSFPLNRHVLMTSRRDFLKKTGAAAAMAAAGSAIHPGVRVGADGAADLSARRRRRSKSCRSKSC